jgi:hypothetical protein
VLNFSDFSFLAFLAPLLVMACGVDLFYVVSWIAADYYLVFPELINRNTKASWSVQ